ncbi:MAG TPA: zinc ABC transporter substrate-binding protein, partial [Pseudonocardiaceae bacterium]|nr:zinc ABC transporter substrate-binding protein [Pseudonocardiaceae bacterium]
STDVWGSVAQAVGGRDVDVRAIIHNPNQDPHDYQSTPLDAARIGAAQLALYNGDGYDDFFSADLHATESASRATIVAFDLAGRPASANEHIFYDLPTVIKVADAVAARLGRIQPAHAAEFLSNAKAFDAGVSGLLATARQIGVRHPGRQVVVTEPVADYLLQAAGVVDATPQEFERAVESDTDVPVAALSTTLNLIAGRQVAAVVDNAQTQTSVTDQLTAKAAAAGIPVVDVTETLPQGVSGYLPWMTAQVSALAAAAAR